MKSTKPKNRRAAALSDVVVTLVILGLGLGFATSAAGLARNNVRADACQENLRSLAIAANQYDARNGRYVGYMNALQTEQGETYVDPRTGKSAPVSWVVELLPDLDRTPLYDKWRQVPAAGGVFNEYLQVQLDMLLCPDDKREEAGPRLSYVANTGRQDLPKALRQSGEPGAAITAATAAKPRDWQANGVFFDNYSEDRYVKPDAATRGPMVIMRSGQIRDPKDKTILFSENLDASSYVFDPKQVPGGDFALTEIGWGSIWNTGKIELAANPTHLPTMKPDAPASPINFGLDEPTRKPDYKYCRPSSKHVGGANAAFAGNNVMFLNEKISYFVYAKLMTSDDQAIKTPGENILADPSLRMYQLSDSDLKP